MPRQTVERKPRPGRCRGCSPRPAQMLWYRKVQRLTRGVAPVPSDPSPSGIDRARQWLLLDHT
ncbi:hypothetical protein FEI13_14130 [Halomonas urmiana]|uniref:Uncharacterized protein n=1 Tax=Halomonas urmiana TaxID=490901 RepID=A0A5R8MDY5_9GAMM|nr:hypothetical protein [Halomonas urmiana]TLF47888.1 hypothetical protein FEI13_14130 [Halomonas urmiana]